MRQLFKCSETFERPNKENKMLFPFDRFSSHSLTEPKQMRKTVTFIAFSYIYIMTLLMFSFGSLRL